MYICRFLNGSIPSESLLSYGPKEPVCLQRLMNTRCGNKETGFML